MAELCLECWNRINETHDSKWRYVLSWDRDLCEECGQYKRVIVAERFWSSAQWELIESMRNMRNQ